MKKEYLLRERDKEEIERLKFQHEVWKEATDFGIEKAGILGSDKIIDLGSGPGYLSFDIMKLLNSEGKVYCVDNSVNFIKYIKNKNIKNIKAVNLDIRSELLEYFPNGQIDKIFCRWVLMFNDKTEKIIQDIYTILKTGGKFVSIEYYNFHQINISPPSTIFNKLYEKVENLIVDNGGNPNIGSKVHKILKEKGFKNIEIHPINRTGKVNSPLWKWLERTIENHTNLVKSNLITQNELDQYKEDWKERSNNKLSFITAPPLMITVAEK